MSFLSKLSKIFGDDNKKYIESIQPLIEEINILEKQFKDFSIEEIKKKTEEFKQKIVQGEFFDNILAPAFALVREMAKRTLSQRHFDVQLIGGIVLHQGKIAEMRTGEGKTLAATLPVYLNALSGKGVHVITVNDYLARRDTVWMGQIYHALGLSVGCIAHDAAYIYDPGYQQKPSIAFSQKEGLGEIQNSERDKERDIKGGFKVDESFLRPVSRKDAYKADITYGTNNEFGFDHLRDNMAYKNEDCVQRELNYAIIDEIDSILIDEARTPLIISAPDVEAGKMYDEFAQITPRLQKLTDYEIDEKLKAVTLTDLGVDKIEKILGMENIYQEKGMRYLHHLEQSLRAEVLFKRDRDYVVKNGEVIIVDEFTGRLMPGRRWSEGLHQAVEAKEKVIVKPESITLASITFQNYFRLYKKLAGMTGTAATSAEEFHKVYGIEVIIIPTNKPMIRIDKPDKIYKSEEGKFKAIVQEIKQYHKKGQPVLIGTVSIQKNEYLGKLLNREGVPHQILNAKQHEREGEIIAQAGRLGAVTVATNMAGRGVDIVLGGNPFDLKKAEQIKKLGGLHIIGTERHEARRTDNQLRGRAGRQGDEGSSQFFISLEDDLMRIFGGDKIKGLMERLKMPEDQPIEVSIISKSIETAQSKVEANHFDARKHILEYDDVMNKHREIFYKKRREVVKKLAVKDIDSKDSLKNYILKLVEKRGLSKQDYEKKEQEVGSENMRQIERFVSLKTLDTLWISHLEGMQYLRDSVRLRAYGQRDPLVEYKNEGHRMFQELLNNIEDNIVQTIFKTRPTISASPFQGVSLNPVRQQTIDNKKQTTYNLQQITNNRQQITDNKQQITSNRQQKIGRNEPCPCGSNKKYKRCCGK